MGDRTLELEDDLAGYAATELDLGYPEVRELMSPRPSMSGVDDRTSLFGARAISATIRSTSGTLKPDEVATLFAPFMVPAARPELHYVLEREGEPERMTVVRAAGYGWPISGKRSREVHLSWVAADPAMLDPAERVETALAGGPPGTGGRIYPLTFARIYPPGSATSTTATISTPGDLAVRPLFRIYGPITTPDVRIQVSEPAANYRILFAAGFRIDAGHYVDVDSDAKTAYLDGSSSVMSSLDWQTSTWPIIPPEPAVAYVNLLGSSTSGVTQVQVRWFDRYLS